MIGNAFLSPLAPETTMTLLAVGGKSSKLSNYIKEWATYIGGAVGGLIIISYFVAIGLLAFQKGRSAEGTKDFGKTTIFHVALLFGTGIIWVLAQIVGNVVGAVKA